MFAEKSTEEIKEWIKQNDARIKIVLEEVSYVEFK